MNSSSIKITCRLAGCLAGLLVAGLAGAGDEDISPNAYQEFDPVTGYMVTVDPDSEQQKGHDSDSEPTAETPASGGEESPGWLGWVVAVAALAGAALWLRSRRAGGDPL